MKYFTFAWWQACQLDMSAEELQRPGRQYRHYFDSIRDHLPPRLTELLDRYSLHDATFRSLELDVLRQSARLSLLVCIRHGNVQEEREGVLLYEAVKSCGSSQPVQDALAGPSGHGDLGYDELEALTTGFEHRLLFSSGIEYAIRFTGFDFDIPVS